MSEKIKPIYYFYGGEDLLAEERVSAIKAVALTGGMASLNNHTFYANALDTNELLNEAMTLPAMSSMRVIVVKGAESLKAPQAKELIDYINDPSPTTCLIFVSNAIKIDRGTAFMKALGKGGFLVCLALLKDAELLGWIRSAASKEGKEITREAATRLLAIAGRRLRDIKGELDKTILYVGEAQSIEESDIEDAGIEVKQETVFTLTDAIGMKDLAAALRVYGKLTGEAPLKLLGSIAWQLRAILKVKSLLALGTPKGQLASKAGIAPFLVDKYLRSSKRFTEAELVAAFTLLSEADLSIKSSGITPDLVMTRLIMELCAGRATRLAG